PAGGGPQIGGQNVFHYDYAMGIAGTDPGNVMYIRSTDNGTTWSTPLQLNTDTTTLAQWMPSLTVTAGGAVLATWYDERSGPCGTAGATTPCWQRYGRVSLDNGATWQPDAPVGDAVSPLPAQPDTNVQPLYAGDYDYSSSFGTTAYTTWDDGRTLIGGSSQQDVYFDKVPLLQGTPTPTVTGTPPTNTPTRTVTNTPTLTPTPCLGANAIVNGGFETGALAPWVAAGGNPNPTIDNTHHHTGSFSGLLGTLSGGEPTGDSILYQTITVPASGGMLNFWYFPLTTDSITFDWQDAYITDTSGNILTTIFHLCVNDGVWDNQTFNMAPYAGQTVRVEFLVHQDGFGDLTSMNVDDVTLQPVIACGTNTATATGTPPTNTPTLTATVTPCVGGWVVDAPLTGARMGAAVGVAGGFIYEAGGYDGAANSLTASRYNGSGSWTAIASMTTATFDASGASDGTKFYVIGGYQAAGVGTTLQIYDPGTSTWSAGAVLPTGEAGAAAVYSNGKIYVFGGCNDNNCSAPLTTLQIYTVGTNTWSTGAAIPQGDTFGSAGVIGNYMYLAGGVSGAASTLKTYRYDPVANTWSDVAMADLPEVWWGAATGVLNGQLYMFGGVLANFSTVTNKTIVYDPVSDTWTYKELMNTASYRQQGATLNSHLYIVGGSTGGFTPTTRVERYNPPACASATPTVAPTNTATATNTATNTVVPSNTATSTVVPSSTATARP
ncbi:MAG TPA: kelch repeat-containing protein, partial [Chloroflexia bacterium]|nr:kelch repeat-containing protein [Chloroflexia bacterium]